MFSLEAVLDAFDTLITRSKRCLAMPVVTFARFVGGHQVTTAVVKTGHRQPTGQARSSDIDFFAAVLMASILLLVGFVAPTR